MLELNIDSGAIKIGPHKLIYGGMGVAELVNGSCVEGPFVIGRDVSYRITEPQRWLEYEVEAIVVRFSKGKCAEVVIHLCGIAYDNNKTVESFLITEYLRVCALGRQEVRGAAELRFHPKWALVTVYFDVKLYSPSVSIRYK